MDDELIEQLAAAEHESWSHWMRYLFDVSVVNPAGETVIPASFVAHWRRQMHTEYSQLTEREKESDRVEVRKILPLIEAAFQSREA